MSITQWRHEDSGSYIGVGETTAELPPGMYDVVVVPQVGLVWDPVRLRDDLLLKFEDSASERVVDEIELFWTQEASFRKYSLPFKRGILLHGPPGSGKSSTLRLVANSVVKKGGYVITFVKPGVVQGAVRQLRQVHPDAAVVVLMEDLDAIMKDGNESDILNMLDGAEEVDKVVFLATTNYPENLKERISNRPSRFDRRVLIPHPSAATRRTYLETVVLPGDTYDLDRYVRDTDGMSLAHVKELFIATAILGANYTETLKELRAMASKVNSVTDSGFTPGGYG